MKKYFIPCIDNEYKPHFFRSKSVMYLGAIIVGLFLITSILQYSISINSSLLATVVSAVLVDLTNTDRSEFNIRPLTINPTLTDAAQLKANDMASKGYFAHTSPEGITPWFWFGEVGYRFSYAGENLAINFSDSQDVEIAWMNSPGHRANILNENFTEIGIATANGLYQGRETTYVVQLFGQPSRTLANTITSLPTVESSVETEDNTTVAGDEFTPVLRTEEMEDLATLVEDEMFVAVKNVSDIESEVFSPTEESLAIPSYASFIERVISSPRTILGYFYMLLGVIISIALILMVFIEIRRQHPLHIAYAFSLLVLIVGLYSLQATLFPDVLVLSA